ncbi:MAG: hypothetical protein DWQ04_20460 [Chloroflexi bacterium]|nr:MAG: hypothetical protein DWQ04_20460 [Chloroflexota bacterium]
MRWIVWGIGGLLVVCLGLTGLSFLLNQKLPAQSSVIDRLSEADKARLAEYFHLRQTVGDAVWPGWTEVDDAALLYNEAYAFLVGVPEPAVGWLTVPGHELRGEAWTLVDDDTFMGQPYFRQPLPESGETPQAFTVQVGSIWVGSFQTREWMEIYFVEQLQSDLPSFLAAIFPYRLIRPLFIGGSDRYISLFAHESFHAFQGAAAEGKLVVAETAVSTHQSQYPWQDANLQAAWQTELDLLQQALRTETDDEVADLAQQFLTQRTLRRSNADLDAELVQYEQHREWVEGLARYVELEIWRQATANSDYQPVPAIADLPDFNAYGGFETRWDREIDQIARMAGDEGDGRFYYTGMAQAVLLDRLMPGWKALAMDDGVALEGLLETAVQ